MRQLRLVSLFGLFSLAIAGPLYAAHDAHHDHSAHHETIDYADQFESASVNPHIQIQQCWVRLLPSHLPSAGYFVIYNNNDHLIELVAAATPSYQQVMLHKTIEVDGMTKMQMAEKIQIPAKDTLVFEPSGLHAMFEKPTSALKVGENMQIELLFSNGEKAITDCKVNSAKARSFD